MDYVRNLNCKTEVIVRTDNICRDVLYFLLRTLKSKKYYIRAQGNVAPYRLGESFWPISDDDAQTIINLDDVDEQHERMNYLSC